MNIHISEWKKVYLLFCSLFAFGLFQAATEEDKKISLTLP